jgi:hypothetical protein
MHTAEVSSHLRLALEQQLRSATQAAESVGPSCVPELPPEQRAAYVRQVGPLFFGV